MTPHDRGKFAAILTGLAELKGKVLSHAALDLFWKSMQDWCITDFEVAAAHLVRTCEFMPTPCDFEGLRKAGRPTTAEAFALAIKHCRTSRYRNGPLGDDIVDRAVAALGGYKAIAMCNEDKLHFLERRFAEHYEALQDVSDIRLALPDIAGERLLVAAFPEPRKRLGHGVDRCIDPVDEE